jgi:predicted transcriptional regulator
MAMAIDGIIAAKGADHPDTRSLRDRRLDAGLTQSQLAEQAGCSVIYVRMLERGYVPQRSNIAPRLAAVLRREDMRQEVAGS